MTARFHVRPIPSPSAIRLAYAETQSVPIAASRCGVPMDVVRDALMPWSVEAFVSDQRRA